MARDDCRAHVKPPDLECGYGGSRNIRPVGIGPTSVRGVTSKRCRLNGLLQHARVTCPVCPGDLDPLTPARAAAEGPRLIGLRTSNGETKTSFSGDRPFNCQDSSKLGSCNERRTVSDGQASENP